MKDYHKAMRFRYSQVDTIFTEQTVRFIYLSPFVIFKLLDVGVLVTHRIRSESWLILGYPERIQALFESLRAGLDYNALTVLAESIVGKILAEDFIAECWQRGLIE